MAIECGTGSIPKQVGAIGQQMGQLDSAIQRMLGAIQALKERLEPILGPDVPTDPKQDPRPPATCKLALGLEEYTNRVTVAAMQIEDMNGRIQL